MAFVFRGEVDEETKMRALQKLYTLLPNHKCPQRDCPFHPPPEEETKEEDELPTEILTKPSQTSAGVEEGGRMMAPPPPPPPKEEDGYPAEMTIDMGEEMVLSDHDSVMTGDSGVGREREDFSDGEVVVLRPLSPEPSPPHPHLQHIDEDEEVMTLTPESSSMVDSSDDERATPVLPEVKEQQIRKDARDLPAYTPLHLPVPEPTPPADFKLQAAPEFTAKLKKKRVPEGLSLHLHCSVTGIPEPQVRWLKDGLEIKPSSGYTIKNNYGLLTLEVLSVGRYHGGVYGCEAFNQHGSVSCEATVTIEGEESVKTIQVEILRPRFLKPLQDLVVTEGQDVLMHCLATGKPMPHLTWQKDMLALTPSTRVTIITDREGGSMLTIRRVKASDAGLYIVLAKSRSGRSQSTATLRVRGGGGSGRQSSPSPSAPRQAHNSYCLATSLTSKVKHDAPPSISLLLPPSLDVHEGESLRLDCSVQGYPTPIVSWYKNHRGLMYGPRHRIMFVGSLHTLHIPQTMALDSGDYIVRAVNHWGNVESVCTVRLLPPREPSDDNSPEEAPLSPSTEKIRTDEESEEKLEAPYFTKALPSTVEMAEGQNFRLDCVLRKGIQLVNWSDDRDTGQRPASAPDDTGQRPSPSQRDHTGQAADGADCSTEASKEETREQPQSGSKQFQQPLPEQVEVRVGESVTLTCIVSQPFTRIRWYKDDSRLSFDSQRLESLREDGGRVLLRVGEVQQSDAGLYRCEATLTDGTQLQSDTRLSVQDQDESQEKGDTRQTTSPAEEMTSSVNEEKTPVLSLHDQRQVVGQGQRAKFKVTVEGASPRTVTWSREGKPLEAGPKFKMYEEGGGHCLEVGEVSREDQGTYVVTVTTQAGAESSTSVSVDIAEKETDANPPEPSPPPPPPPPPTLQSSLPDMDVVIGDRDVKLKCEVDVSEGSTVRVRWYHEGREVEGDKGYRWVWTGKEASLTLRQITPQHAGVYKCVVSNAGGEATTSCTLSVREPEKLEPPYFVRELHDMEVVDGDKVELLVEVEGHPVVQVYWHHNNVPVTTDTPGVHLHAARNVHSLVIPQTSTQHGGEYVCEAYNACGDTDSFCRLHVKEHAAPDPPAFLAPPPSLAVPEGAASAVFTCRVKGRPSPAVTWTHQGTLLLSDHCYTITSRGDTHSLQILAPQRSDAGEYECHVHNTAGTVTGRCSLKVTEATPTASSTSVTARRDVEHDRQKDRSDHDKEAQRPDTLLSHAHQPPSSPSSSPTDSSTTPTSTVTTTMTVTTPPTTQVSRGRSTRPVGRSPTWHSTLRAPIRVGSVRKRRDWFEQRASPSPDRASQGVRRSASSLDRQRQRVPGDKASPSTPDNQGHAALYDGSSPLDTDSHDVLAPAIYQIKMMASPSDNADKSKARSLTTSSLTCHLSSQPGSTTESGSESYSPGTPDSHHTMESLLADSSRSHTDPGRREDSITLPASFSAEAPRNRTVQRKAADSDILRPHSPGRMDFRSVLRTRQPQTESRQQHGGRSTEEPSTDFRSVLKKTTEASVKRRLFPDNGAGTTNIQNVSDAAGFVRQSVDRVKTDIVQTVKRLDVSGASESALGLTESTYEKERAVSQLDGGCVNSGNMNICTNTGKRGDSVLQPKISQSITVIGHTDIITPATETDSETTKEPTSVSLLATTAKSDIFPESSEQRYVTSARTTIKLSAPSLGSQPPSNSGTGEGRSGDVTRKTGGDGGQCEGPRVVQGLENQRVYGGGQVVMRCVVSGHPHPHITWTHNGRDIKPSRFFQLSYQAPHAQLLIAEACSEDEGEYTCTASNEAGTASSSCVLTVEDRQVKLPPVLNSMENSSGMDSMRDQRQLLVKDPARNDVTGISSADDDTAQNTSDQGTGLHSRQTRVVLAPGRKFEDVYDYVREVGRGKFGSVYECRERRTGAVLAAKVLKVRGQGRKEDVRREVEVMNALFHHPSLLTLLDAFEADRTMVLITEFVGGGELLERVSGEQYVLTEQDCVHFLRQLCEGVAYMHGRGVLHLDLKPNNVLCLSPQSTRIKIIDFGLARFYKAGDSLHVLFGTPEFVAPEVISYDDISFDTDMWSVGVMAYILLSGLSPFLGDTDAETLSNVTRGDYDFDDDSFDVISDDAKDFISRLLLKRKEKRLSAEQCQRHTWLSRHDERLKTRRLNTENLRSFVAAHRKRWHTTAQAIMAVQRISSLAKITPSHGKTNSTQSGDSTHC